jgi:hypothetical protein
MTEENKYDIGISFDDNELGFDNDRYSGIRINWGSQGVGFGQLELFVEKETGKLKIDTEYMGKNFAKQVFQALIDMAESDTKE